MTNNYDAVSLQGDLTEILEDMKSPHSVYEKYREMEWRVKAELAKPLDEIDCDVLSKLVSDFNEVSNDDEDSIGTFICVTRAISMFEDSLRMHRQGWTDYEHFIRGTRMVSGKNIGKDDGSIVMYCSTNDGESYDWTHTLTADVVTGKDKDVKVRELMAKFISDNYQLKVEDLFNFDEWLEVILRSITNAHSARYTHRWCESFCLRPDKC